MSPPETDRYRLTLRALPDGVPEMVRLRRLLKLALRAFGFRCERVEELPAMETVRIKRGALTTLPPGVEISHLEDEPPAKAA